MSEKITRESDDDEKSKQREVWDLTNDKSVISCLKDKLEVVFERYIYYGEGEDDNRDFSWKEKLAQELLKDPLAYLKKLEKESWKDSDFKPQLSFPARRFIDKGGITPEEAYTILDRALAALGHTREDLERKANHKEELRQLLGPVTKALTEISQSSPKRNFQKKIAKSLLSEPLDERKN